MNRSTFRLRTLAALAVVCLCGSVTAVAMGKNGADDGTTTGTTGTTNTTPSNGAPSIREIEVDSVAGGKLRLRTEVSGRATSVRFTYRSRTYKGKKISSNKWARTVAARGGDRRDSVIKVRVRACNGSKCTTRSGSDDA
jgi:hypothetical protein